MEDSGLKPRTQPTVNAIPPNDDPGQKSGQPPIAGRPPVNPNAIVSKTKQKGSYYCRPDQTPVMKIVLEVIAVVVGCAYTIAAYQQLTVMGDTLKLERPWIGPTGRQKEGHNYTDPITKKSSCTWTEVNWYFQNGGRNPAVRTRINIVVKLGPPIPKSLDLPESDLPKNDGCEKGKLDDKFGNLTHHSRSYRKFFQYPIYG